MANCLKLPRVDRHRMPRSCGAWSEPSGHEGVPEVPTSARHGCDSTPRLYSPLAARLRGPCAGGCRVGRCPGGPRPPIPSSCSSSCLLAVLRIANAVSAEAIHAFRRPWARAINGASVHRLNLPRARIHRTHFTNRSPCAGLAIRCAISRAIAEPAAPRPRTTFRGIHAPSSTWQAAEVFHLATHGCWLCWLNLTINRTATRNNRHDAHGD